MPTAYAIWLSILISWHPFRDAGCGRVGPQPSLTVGYPQFARSSSLFFAGKG